jgi:hypothetical protein
METEQAQRAQRVVALHALRETGTQVFLMVMGSGKRLRDQQNQRQRRDSAGMPQAGPAVTALEHQVNCRLPLKPTGMTTTGPRVIARPYRHFDFISIHSHRIIDDLLEQAYAQGR